MSEQITITVSACSCPFHQTEDTVKGFKVGDREGRWWSYCWQDHTEFQPLADDAIGPLSEEVFADNDRLWFHWLEDQPGICLIEGPTTGRTIAIVLEE